MSRLRRDRSGKSSWARPTDQGILTGPRLASQGARAAAGSSVREAGSSIRETDSSIRETDSSIRERDSRPPSAPTRSRAASTNGGGNAALAAEIARAVVGEVGKGVGSLAPAVTRVGASVRAGIGRVGNALDDPSHAITAELLEQTNLPQLDGKDPLSSLAVRLDQEADLWRGIALRQIARAAWTERITMGGAVLAFAGEATLGGVGGFRALFASSAASTPVVLGVAAVVLALGAITIAWVAAVVRRGQLAIGRDALDRADCAEARLRRVAALMEIRGLDPGAYVEDLRDLERDDRRR